MDDPPPTRLARGSYSCLSPIYSRSGEYLQTSVIFDTVYIHVYSHDMNIYITQANEKKLRQVENATMSGLINKLLYEYFDTHDIKDLKKVEKKIKKTLDKNPLAADVIQNPEKYEVHNGVYEKKCQGHDMKWDCGQPGCKYAN